MVYALLSLDVWSIMSDLSRWSSHSRLRSVSKSFASSLRAFTTISHYAVATDVRSHTGTGVLGRASLASGT